MVNEDRSSHGGLVGLLLAKCSLKKILILGISDAIISYFEWDLGISYGFLI